MAVGNIGSWTTRQTRLVNRLANLDFVFVEVPLKENP
jgi:hypothetical protein